MKHTKFSVRRSALLLAVTFSLIISTLLFAVEVGAKDLNLEADPEDQNFSWKIDFESMSSLTDNKGSSEYSLQISSSDIVKLVTVDGRKALGIVSNRGYYYINDTNNIFNTYDTFYVEADMYFEKYPTGNNGSETPQNYPMSFVTWMTKGTSGGSTSYRSIRINHEGYLCTGNSPETNPDQITNVKIPLKEWFTIRFAISPKSGHSEVFINGESMLVYSIGSPKDTASSIIRFFDNRYNYSVYLSDISICSDSNMLIGLVDEPTVNYLAYQTTEIDTVDGKQCFDLRLVSGVDSLEYSGVGYDITVIQEIDGVVVTRQVNLTSNNVYDSILADHIRVDASEYGVKYLVAMAINDITVNADYIEIVVMPYAIKNGLRIFGDSVYLSWRGTAENGYPVFSYNDYLESFSTIATEDTHTRAGSNTSNNYGSNTLVELKNNGTNSSTTRHAYFKFDFNTDIAKERLKICSKIYFDFCIKSMRAPTTAESALGGIEVKVYGVSNSWSESTLTHTSAKNLSTTLITSARLQGSDTYCRVDVTDYVLAHINDGQVSFKLVNVADDGSSGQTSIYSSESSSGQPMLVTYTSRINHEINLPKLLNYGYEPWGYAEKLVNEWIETDRDLLYSPAPYDTINLNAVDLSKSSGAYSNSFVKYSNNPTSTSSSSIYVRNLASLSQKAGYSNTTVSQYDKYGGITNSGIKGNATGYFHLETFGNRQYIIDPIGNPFFSIGINTAQLGANTNQKNASLDKYGTSASFYSSVADEMRSLGFNTYWGGDDEFFNTGKLCRAVGLSCMSEYMKDLGLSISTGGSAKYQHNNTMNVFDPDFITHCQSKANSVTAKYLTGSYSQYKDFVLGFYSDNEIPSQKDMLYCYLTIDPSAPVNAFSYATAWTYLMRMTGKANPSVDDITPELSEEFKALVYNAYFKAVTKALEDAGAGEYMYLGNRIHSSNMTSEGYLRAAAQYMDIISANLYGGVEPPIETIKTMYKYSGKPFIVSEFFSKANDAVDMNGYTLGNQANAGLIVKTQADRALMYENYTLLLLESQTCVGWTWYRFRDNDQTIYQDANGNKYRAFDYQNGAVSAYVNVATGAKVSLSNMPAVTVFYQGETDTSNLGSNKGIYDNKMNLYTELTNSMKLITDNIFGIINHFDKIH